MKTPNERAREVYHSLTDSMSADVDIGIIERAISAAVADAVAAEREACAKIVDGFASGHHFAGDMAGEKSFRRCIEVIRARTTTPPAEAPTREDARGRLAMQALNKIAFGGGLGINPNGTYVQSWEYARDVLKQIAALTAPAPPRPRAEAPPREDARERVVRAARAMAIVCGYPCGNPNKCGNCKALADALDAAGGDGDK